MTLVNFIHKLKDTDRNILLYATKDYIIQLTEEERELFVYIIMNTNDILLAKSVIRVWRKSASKRLRFSLLGR